MIEFQNLARAFVEPGKFSPEFVADYYRALFPDLDHLTLLDLESHYEHYGRDEGRSASPCDLRATFLACLEPTIKVLEIGPFTAPSLRGPNVKYFDVRDADGLRARAKAHNFPIIEPVRIDFVSANGNLEVVPPGFDAVYSAHCIEHTPDLIGHFNQVSNLLGSSGTYLLTIPDMRYTLDHFRVPTLADDLVAAHKEGRQLHSRQAVMDYWLLSTHNDPAAHWRGDHGVLPAPDAEERKACAERELAESNGGYVDIHAWFFTPTSFRTAINDLRVRSFCDFDLLRVYTTPHGRNEFNAVLRKT